MLRSEGRFQASSVRLLIGALVHLAVVNLGTVVEGKDWGSRKGNSEASSRGRSVRIALATRWIRVAKSRWIRWRISIWRNSDSNNSSLSRAPVLYKVKMQYAGDRACRGRLRSFIDNNNNRLLNDPLGMAQRQSHGLGSRGQQPSYMQPFPAQSPVYAPPPTYTYAAATSPTGQTVFHPPPQQQQQAPIRKQNLIEAIEIEEVIAERIQRVAQPHPREQARYVLWNEHDMLTTGINVCSTIGKPINMPASQPNSTR